MVNALNIMIEKRKECGVPDQNEYLFAVLNCLTLLQRTSVSQTARR